MVNLANLDGLVWSVGMYSVRGTPSLLPLPITPPYRELVMRQLGPMEDNYDWTGLIYLWCEREGGKNG